MIRQSLWWVCALIRCPHFEVGWSGYCSRGRRLRPDGVRRHGLSLRVVVSEMGVVCRGRSGASTLSRTATPPPTRSPTPSPPSGVGVVGNFSIFRPPGFDGYSDTLMGWVE